MIVDGGDAQIIAAHEFGHAFGLGDQYATDAGGFISGTGRATGSRSPHDDQTKKMTDSSGTNLGGSVNENNADIMSLGNKVSAQHYSMFHSALGEITGMHAVGARAEEGAGHRRPARRHRRRSVRRRRQGREPVRGPYPAPARRRPVPAPGRLHVPGSAGG